MILSLFRGKRQGKRQLPVSKTSTSTLMSLCPRLIPFSQNCVSSVKKPLKQLQCLTKFLADYQYVRIVDKGSGELWGFCCSWVWDSVADFMIANISTHGLGHTSLGFSDLCSSQ